MKEGNQKLTIENIYGYLLGLQLQRFAPEFAATFTSYQEGNSDGRQGDIMREHSAIVTKLQEEGKVCPTTDNWIIADALLRNPTSIPQTYEQFQAISEQLLGTST